MFWLAHLKTLSFSIMTAVKRHLGGKKKVMVGTVLMKI